MECSKKREAYLRSTAQASLQEQVSSSLSSNEELNNCRLQLCCMGIVSHESSVHHQRSFSEAPSSDYWQQRSLPSRWHLNNRQRRCSIVCIQISVAGLCVSVYVQHMWGEIIAQVTHPLPEVLGCPRWQRNRRLSSVAGGRVSSQEMLQPLLPHRCCWCYLLEAHTACSYTLFSIHLCTQPCLFPAFQLKKKKKEVATEQLKDLQWTDDEEKKKRNKYS